VEGTNIRLLIFNHRPIYPPTSGGAKVIYDTSESLLKQGFEVRVVTLSSRYKSYTVKDDHFKIFEVPSRLWQAFALPLKMMSYSIKSTSFIQWRAIYDILARDIAFQNSVSAILKEYDPDLILCEHIYGYKALSFIKTYLHIPLVIRELNVEAEYMALLCTDMLSKVAEGTIRGIESQALKGSSAVITLSLRDVSKIRQLYGIHADFTGVGMEVTDYGLVGSEIFEKLQLLKDDAYYLFISSATKFALRSLEDLTQIFSRLPKVKLVAAGNVSKYVKSKQNIISAGFVKPEELYQLYIHCHGVLAPLWRGSGVLIKMVEGLAHGQAVITTKWVAETLPNLSHLQNIYVVNSTSELEKAIRILETDEGLRESLRKGAKSYHHHHLKWEHVTQRMEKVFKRVVT